MDSDRLYYTLEPLYHGGVIYAPLDTPVPMRPVLSRDEAEGLISGIPAMRSQYARQADSKLAAAEYKACLATYDPTNLLHLIRKIYIKNKEAITAGKGYGQIDDRFLKRAKELLYGELAVSLGIAREQVESAIVRAVEGDQKK